MNKKILLIEPSYRAKYPPLGLLKISRHYKENDDEVTFVKGCNKQVSQMKWDLVFITTLFTFQWNSVIKTVNYYKECVDSVDKIKIGGIMASLLQEDMEKETGIKPYFGIWKEIDSLKPDYHLLKESNYMADWDASIGFATRGCPNSCQFCAVPKLEKDCDIDRQYSLENIVDPTKSNLILWDNNVLASKNFPRIIREIKEFGFHRGAKLGRRKRYVDFNQGVDSRRLTENKMKLLSEIALRPLRIAFDDIGLKEIYIDKILLAKKYNIRDLSNFILYNFEDSPEDFYERLRVNIELNRKYDLDIYSFPMRFVPLDLKSRRDPAYKEGHESKWNEKELRGLQLILNATHGIVGPKMKFFDTAFGRNANEFREILITRPEEKILYRSDEWLNRPFRPNYLYV